MRPGLLIRILLVAGVALELGASAAVAGPRHEALRVINHRRLNHGCERLVSTGLRPIRSARQHSRAMADAGELFHSELDLGPWAKIGEAIGVGPTWRGIVRALFESRSHRELLLDCDYDKAALGFVTRDAVWLTARLYAG